MKKPAHPAEETAKSQLLHVWVPCALSLALLIISVILDLCHPETHWTQRSGAVLIVVGAYIAFHEARWRERYALTDDDKVVAYYNPEIWYKWLALFLVLVGTMLAGYGDLIL